MSVRLYVYMCIRSYNFLFLIFCFAAQNTYFY